MRSSFVSWGIRFSAVILVWVGSLQALDLKPAYLPISDEVAATISAKFGISLSRGLYYSDPWEAKLVPELRDKRFFGNATKIDLADVQGLMRILRYPGTDAPLTGQAGFVDVIDAQGQPVRQLWLVTNRNQKWMLYESSRENPTSFRTTRVMNLPSFFMTVPGGIIAVTSTGELFYKVRKEERGLAEFAVTDLKGKSFTQTLNVALALSEVPAEFRIDRDQEEVPVMSYNSAAKALLLAIRPTPQEEVEPGVIGAREVQIALLDLDPASPRWKKAKLIDPSEISETNDDDNLGTELPWPLYLDRRGVYFPMKGAQGPAASYRFKPFDWGTQKLGRSRPLGGKETGALEVSLSGGELSIFRRVGNGRESFALSSDGRPVPMARPVTPYAELKKNEVDELIGLGGARDILNEIRTGAWDPDYYDPTVNDTLLRELDGGAKSWTLVVYEQGQAPLAAIGNFLWAVDAHLLPATNRLSHLQTVPSYLSDTLVKGKNDADVRQDFETLKERIDGTNAAIVFEDLPTPDIAQGLSPVNQTRIQTFAQIFGPCSLQRSCRVITTLRKEVYEGLQKQSPGLFDSAHVLTLPRATPAMSRQILKLAVGDCEVKRGLPCNPAAFRSFSDWVIRNPVPAGTPAASPGKEIALADRLFNAALAEGGSDPQAKLQEIDVGFVRRFTSGGSAGVSASVDGRIDVEAMRAYVKHRTAGAPHKKIVDRICDRIAAIQNGAVARDVPHCFILIGPSAVGKSHIAKLISSYLAGGESGEPNLFDMRQYKTTQFRIEPNSPQARKFKETRSLKAVIFDDVHEASKASLTTLTQLFETGIYGAGSDAELDFRNSLLFWTTTWGDDLLKEDGLNDGDFEQRIVEYLKNSPQGPQMRDEDFTRLRAHIYRIPRLQTWDLIEVGMMQARDARERFRSNGRDMLIHPSVIKQLVGTEKTVGGQGRAIRDGIVKAVESLTDKIRPEGSQRFIVRHSPASGFVGQREEDSKTFEADWEKLSALYETFNTNGIDPVLQEWFADVYEQKMQKEGSDEN